MSDGDGDDAVTGGSGSEGDGRGPRENLARVMPVRVTTTWLRVLGLLAWVAIFVVARPLGAYSWVALVALLLALNQASKRWTPREVASAPGGVRVGDKVFARKDLRSATPMSEKGRLFVRLERSFGRRTDLDVKSEEEAAELLRDLGLDAERSAMSFLVHAGTPSRKALAMLPFALFAFFWMGGATMIGSSLYPLGALLVPVVFFGLRRAQQLSLIVGTDGVQLNGLTKSVFYKHSAIGRVEVVDATLVLHLKSGEEVTLSTSRQRKKPRPEELELARRIRDRIMAARVAAESAGAAGNREAETTSLERGGRSPGEWVEFLRRVGDGAEASFRKAAVTRSALLATLENPASRALDRVAAAVSLARGLTVEEAPRVRVALEACAEQRLAARLRVAIEDPSPEALERALLEAEAEEQRVVLGSAAACRTPEHD